MKRGYNPCMIPLVGKEKLQQILARALVTISRAELKDWKISLASGRRWNDLAACHKSRLDRSSWLWDGRALQLLGEREPWGMSKSYPRPVINVRSGIDGLARTRRSRDTIQDGPESVSLPIT